MQPAHKTSDRVMAEARLGPARLGGAYAWKSVQASGAKLAFGSDVPVELSDPWAGWAAAISRVDSRIRSMTSTPSSFSGMVRNLLRLCLTMRR